VGRYWQKAQQKEIEQLLEAFDEAEWRIEDPPKYYRVKCPCGLHQRWIHLTPSGAHYIKNALAWMHRQGCQGELARRRGA